MARRILSIDWDGIEARFAFGFVQKDRLIVLKAGAAPIVDAAEKVAEVASSIGEIDGGDDLNANGDGDSRDENDVVETVETTGEPPLPPTDFDEDEPTVANDPSVVSAVKKSKSGESFKTSPLARTLKKLLRERRVGAATVVYLAERGDVDVFFATIPQANDAETPELVRNQALRDSLTFNETQPLDYLPLGSPARQRSATRRIAAVSTSRENLRRVRETLIGAVRAPSKIGLREPALAEFLRVRACGLTFAEPVVLVQELCDEVGLAVCDGENLLFFRSFKIQADADAPARAERIREEIVRTIAVGIDDLPEDAVVAKALYFTGETRPQKAADADESEKSNATQGESNDAENAERSDAERADDAAPTVGLLLTRLLADEGIALEFTNPFRLPGVKLKSAEPENPGRFASLLGAILAERPQSVPAIDLLHPREKPKPPNYALCVVSYLFVVGLAFAAFWFWNKNDLKRINAEIVALEAKRDAAAKEAYSKQPLYNALTTANAWQNAQGVVVLDELRDITARIPKAPDLVVTRLAYLGSSNGRPAFVISAKITSLEVYQRFRASLIADGSHGLASQRGAVPNVGGGGYRYLFDANIICRRRPAQAFVAKLPNELQAISNDLPEYFAEQARERQDEAKRLQEEAQKKAAAEREAAQKRLEEERQKQEEARKAQEEAAAQNAANAAQNAAEPNANADANAPQNPQNAQDSATLKQRLLKARAALDERFKGAQAAFQRGETTQEQFAPIQAEYQISVRRAVFLWNRLGQFDANMSAAQTALDKGEIDRARFDQIAADYRNAVGQVAQNCDRYFPQPPEPAPETPAPPEPAPEAPAPPEPAPETPAPPEPAPEAPAPPEPAPEAPAPSEPAPETPAPAEGAPSAALERSQFAGTEV